MLGFLEPGLSNFEFSKPLSSFNHFVRCSIKRLFCFRYLNKQNVAGYFWDQCCPPAYWLISARRDLLMVGSQVSQATSLSTTPQLLLPLCLYIQQSRWATASLSALIYLDHLIAAYFIQIWFIFQIWRLRRDAEPGHRRDAAEPDAHRGLRTVRGQKVRLVPLQRKDVRLQPDPGASLAGSHPFFLSYLS